MSFPNGAAAGALPPLARQFRHLILAALLPLALLGALALALAVERERETFRRGSLERVRALSSALDAQLRSDMTTLQTLSLSPLLAAGDLAAYHALLQRVLPSLPNWQTVSLSDPSGQQILNALRPYDTALPQVADPASLADVLRARRPTVGGIARGTVTGKMSYAVRVPVIDTEGRVRYVLSAIVDPASIAALLKEQHFPSGWVGVVLDAQQRIVARTVDAASSIGNLASQSLRNALASADEGFFAGHTLEGTPVYTPFVRSSFSGWSVAIGVPRSAIDAAGWQSAVLLALAIAVTLLLALTLAWWSARRIAAPIGALAERAQRLAAGDAAPRDGSGAPAAASREVALVQDAFDRAATAIHERARAQRLFETVAHNAALALFVLDEGGCCVYLNPAATTMCGRTPAEAQGLALPALLRLNTEGALSKALTAGLAQRGEDDIAHRAGTRVPVAFAVSPLHHLDGTRGSVVELRDVSEELAYEGERAALLAREQALREQAEQDNRAKDEFLAMLGHELRNPLAALTNAAHLLRLRPGGDVAESARGVIERQLRHLGRMVDDLLDAARVATGKIALLRAPVDLAALVARAAEAHERAGGGARHPLRIASVPCWVEGDETRLEQVLANLLGNAVRYSPDGGPIDIELAPQGAQVVLRMRDRGVGMAPELVPRVFDLFSQGKRAIERAQGGLGIGLTLVQRLVQLHGGSVEAASDGEGQGSTFTLRLPRIEAPMSAMPDRTSLVAPVAARRRVLVVEDNDDARATLCETLQHAGHRVAECADGESAIQAALRDEPDVVLIDIGLPGASGLEVARRIRERQRKPMLLVALSGYGQPQDRQRSIEAGFDLHEVKPVNLAALLQTIERWPLTDDATAG